MSRNQEPDPRGGPGGPAGPGPMQKQSSSMMPHRGDHQRGDSPMSRLDDLRSGGPPGGPRGPEGSMDSGGPRGPRGPEGHMVSGGPRGLGGPGGPLMQPPPQRPLMTSQNNTQQQNFLFQPGPSALEKLLQQTPKPPE